MHPWVEVTEHTPRKRPSSTGSGLRVGAVTHPGVPDVYRRSPRGTLAGDPATDRPMESHAAHAARVELGSPPWGSDPHGRGKRGEENA